MEIKELRGLSSEELLEREKAFRRELFNLRFQKVTGHLEKPSHIRVIRRDIARILTILKVKKSDST